MIESINISENSEFISFSINIEDTINYEKVTEIDTSLPVVKLSKDSIRDSIPLIPKIDIHDSVIADSVKPQIVKTVEYKFKEKIPRKTDKIQDYLKDYYPEKLTWNTSKNFLIRSDNYDTVDFKNSISNPNSQNIGNLKKTFLSHDNINMLPLKRDTISNDWLLGLLIFISLLFLWVKIFYKKYFNLLFGSLISYQTSLKLLRGKNIMTRRVSFVLNFIYSIVLALFILRILKFYEIKILKFNTFETLLFLINLIIIISIVRLLILNLVGIIFNSTQIFNEYIHNNYIINKNLALFLFPLLIMQVYINEKLQIIFIIAGISLVIISYIIRLYRGFQIIIKKDIFLFYLILYLCTLEILPVLLGYKLFFLLV
jgi:hypothetical protein